MKEVARWARTWIGALSLSGLVLLSSYSLGYWIVGPLTSPLVNPPLMSANGNISASLPIKPTPVRSDLRYWKAELPNWNGGTSYNGHKN